MKNDGLTYCYRKWKGLCENKQCMMWWGCKFEHIKDLKNQTTFSFALRYAPKEGCPSKRHGFLGIAIGDYKRAKSEGWIE